ncbi:SMI1/KNR4 family protein [Brachyspira alvinipulli]|uniref:SMI1/KNR4 family protein n=1 Tax=Brachyspira alvinipulli TaxID=84379 RepID=UPI0004884A32|nr:SMI1/KNR4 family protein [Brachyspira alvinipulli]
MINTNKELNNERKQNILNLLNKCKETDKNFKQFASESHKYKLNPPINKNKVIELENKYQFKLPEDYFWFITEVGNGGACHGYSMDKFEDMYFDYLKYDNRMDLMIEYSKKVNEGNANDIENTDFEYYGILRFGTLGCSSSIGLIVTGKNRGKVVYYDDEFYEEPFITCYNNFVDYYENWALETSLDYNMGSFGIRLKFEIDDLIKYYYDILNNNKKEDNIINKQSIITTMHKYKSLEEKYLNELYNLYNLEKDENYKLKLVYLLDNHNYKKIEKHIKDAFQNKDIIDSYVKVLYLKVHADTNLYVGNFKKEIFDWTDEIKSALEYYKKLTNEENKTNNYRLLIDMALYLYKNDLIDFKEFDIFINNRNSTILYILSLNTLENDNIFNIYINEFVESCSNKDTHQIRNTIAYLENILKNNKNYKKEIINTIKREYQKLLEYYKINEPEDKSIIHFINNTSKRIFNY